MRTKDTHPQTNNLVQILSFLIISALLPAIPSFAKDKNADINISTSGIYAAGAHQMTYMELSVTDPSGQIIFNSLTDGSPIAWTIPAGVPDGFYSYEVRLGKEPKKEKRDSNDNSQGLGPKTKAIVESGSILIENGFIVLPTGEETSMLDTILSNGSYALNRIIDFIVTPAVADQVINDDLIVTFSECIGNDCVNGEIFDFDTLRLKENNLRISFDDTSTASFPNNDWQITINDSASGGANKFSIDDISGARTPFTIEAGAPSHSLYVEDGGRVGLGTSLPVVDLHIKGGNTPTVRLDQDGTSGFAPQTWDIAGNEANFFIRDVTNGSTLPIRIRPGAPTSSIDISSSGNVGIGTNSPQQKLHVDGNALISGNLELGSSRKIKDNIEALGSDEALQTVAMLRPVKFQYKVSPEEDSIGFIAEDVPDMVATSSRKSISTMDVVAVLTKVVQEQQKAIDELNKTIAQLTARVENNQNPH